MWGRGVSEQRNEERQWEWTQQRKDGGGVTNEVLGWSVTEIDPRSRSLSAPLHKLIRWRKPGVYGTIRFFLFIFFAQMRCGFHPTSTASCPGGTVKAACAWMGQRVKSWREGGRRRRKGVRERCLRGGRGEREKSTAAPQQSAKLWNTFVM